MEAIIEMLKTVINGQHALRFEFPGEISKWKQETREDMKILRNEVKVGFEEVNERLDKLRGWNRLYLKISFFGVLYFLSCFFRESNKNCELVKNCSYVLLCRQKNQKLLSW